MKNQLTKYYNVVDSLSVEGVVVDDAEVEQSNPFADAADVVVDDAQETAEVLTPTQEFTEIVGIYVGLRGFSEDTFNRQRRIAISNFDNWSDCAKAMNDAEVAWVELHIPDSAIKRSKAGKVFVSEHTTLAYRSAKSTIRGMFECGVSHYDENGDLLTKDACGEAIAEAREAAKPTPTAAEVEVKNAAALAKALTRLLKCLGEMENPAEAAEAAVTDIQAIYPPST
jgi:hypothetical protein